MLDSDLAGLYGVSVKRLNEQVRRNLKRFPSDFMIRLNRKEFEALRSHFATLRQGRGEHRKYLPYAFTEQGVAMLSSVLNSERAIEVNIEIMRAFTKLRHWLSRHKELAQKPGELERKIGRHDEQIQIIFEASRQLMTPPEPNQAEDRVSG
jgi:phage regulator Rha-like protein